MRTATCVSSTPTRAAPWPSPRPPAISSAPARRPSPFRARDPPVIPGNVSLYNETSGEAVYPTPVVGMLGLIEDVERIVPMGFQDEGAEVYLLGVAALQGEA